MLEKHTTAGDLVHAEGMRVRRVRRGHAVKQLRPRTRGKQGCVSCWAPSDRASRERGLQIPRTTLDAGERFQSKTHRHQLATGVARSAGLGPAPMNKGALAVSVDAMSPELTAALAAPRITCVLRFGRVACLTTDLACTGGGIVLACG